MRREGVHVKSNGQGRDVDIEVVPLGAPAEDRSYLVLFFDAGAHAVDESTANPKATRGKSCADQRKVREEEIGRLRQELAASREYLQSIIQDLEAANEELQSANEEILSSNEELQSTNEELDTAKEELQSTNEELNTLNEELHGRNEELSRVNSDLINLLGSVQIAIVMVSGDLRIRRFTPMAEKILNLIPTDIGRPIGHIKPNIDCPDIEHLISEVVDTMTTSGREVRDKQGRWYSLRIRPYKNIENRIDGAVLALFDIQAVKRQQGQLIVEPSFVDQLLSLIREPAMFVDAELCVRAVNEPFGELFGIAHDQPLDTPVAEFQRGFWKTTELPALLQAERDGDGTAVTRPLSLALDTAAPVRAALSVRRFAQADGQLPSFIVTIRPE